MCTDNRTIINVIEDAKADANEVFSLYEQDKGLVGLVKVFNKALTIFYDVKSDGELDYYKHDRCHNVTHELIRRTFGVDEQCVREFYRVYTC